MKRSQRGVALLSVLLVMSLALLLTAGMLRSHQLMLQSGTRQLHQVQLRQVAQSAEAWALSILAAGDDEHHRVHTGQEWAQARWPFPTDAARISLHIEDLGGRLNINTLLGEGQVDQVAQQRHGAGTQPIAWGAGYRRRVHSQAGALGGGVAQRCRAQRQYGCGAGAGHA